MNKVYVDVVAEFSKEGCLIPILFVWEDGRKYKIDKVLKIERCASRKQAVLVRCTPVWYRGRKAICFLKWINGLWKGRFHN